MTSPRLVLINPPSPVFRSPSSPFRLLANSMPSVALCQLAAVVRQRGYEPSIIEAAADGLDFPHVVSQLRQLAPEFIGISCYSSAMPMVHRLSRWIRRHLPSTKIIWGGPHVSALKSKMPSLLWPLFDALLVGEADYSLPQLLDVWSKEGDTMSVPGLIIHHRGGLQQSKAPRTPVNLDELPFPAYELLRHFPQGYHPPLFSYTQGPAAPLLTSRGCPYSCKFCDHSVFGTQYRTMSVSRILELITQLHHRFGIRHVLFVDDHLTFNRRRLRDFCEQLIACKLPINWSADARIDTLDEEDFSLMRQAGCQRINCGIESGDPNLLVSMNKKLNLNKAKSNIRTAIAAGLQVKGLFIIGFPGETRGSISNTLQLLRKTPFTEINVTRFTPYPGTPYYHDYLGERDECSFWHYLDGLHNLESDSNTAQLLNKAFWFAYLSFYSRFSVGINYLKLMWRMKESRVRIIHFLKAIFSEIVTAMIYRLNRTHRCD